jgi:FAD/FMN-containing dehydrogenase
MLTKTNPDEIQSFLTDASHMRDGRAERVVFPENADEVAEILRAATAEKTPVTVSGAGTGTVGGRIPFAGIVLATDKLKQIKSIVQGDQGGRAIAEAGVTLSDLQRFVDSENLFYPPDPTERSCFLGGTIATNASGARTFKYGPTRAYVQRLKIVLATGDVIDLRRGDLQADASGQIKIPLATADPPATAGGSDKTNPPVIAGGTDRSARRTTLANTCETFCSARMWRERAVNSAFAAAAFSGWRWQRNYLREGPAPGNHFEHRRRVLVSIVGF